MFSTEKSENRFRTILLTIALLLSAIVMVPNTASAEDERLEVHANTYNDADMQRTICMGQHVGRPKS